YQSKIIVNENSTVNITEKIIADAGNLPDKHGIFRILPTQVYKTFSDIIFTPIKLLSITDFNDNKIPYQTITNTSDKTLTWKIGDGDKTVIGENDYKINYIVKNVIRFDNDNFDEFYWNLNGNFWEIETDSFTTSIVFPQNVDRNKSEVNLYSGSFGEKNADLAEFTWVDDNILRVNSKQTLAAKAGISISVTFPKGIFTPYQFTFWEKYGQYFWLLIPFFILLISYLLWSKYGRDPKINPTVVPEFDAPLKMSPMELGMVLTDGSMRNHFISAEIISLAVKGALKIEQIKKKGIFDSDDYKLTLIKKDISGLTNTQAKLIGSLFSGKSELLLSTLKNKFYEKIPNLTSSISNQLVSKKLLLTRSKTLFIVFLILAIVSIFMSFIFFGLNFYLGFSIFISGLILLVFSFLMKARTPEGAEMLRKIRGFELYMKTAEKYRQKFNEKENIFERFLPYAIMFGITGLWIEKMKEIYGEEYFVRYHPIWFYGTNFDSFNSKSFNSMISGVSSSMASTLSSSPSGSGAGGGGFSGGGGGGGGGGGW
ncbi:hypothetical protein A3F08_02895, partial [Candidatus Berkelbacteria bacterium RIFCSPHIGHO2_12_FULL_36_9]